VNAAPKEAGRPEGDSVTASADASSPPLLPAKRRQAGTDRFDAAIVVTRTRAWIGLSACLVLVVAILVWSVVANVGVTVEGSGVALANGAIAVVRSPVAGTVQSLDVKVGETVTASQVVGSVADSQQNIHPLVAPVGGRVLDVNESVGSSIDSAGPAASIAQTSGPLLVRAFVSPTQAQQVGVGTPALLAFPGQPEIHGKVVDVGILPLTVNQAADSIGSVALASLLVKGGAVVPVTVVPDAASSTGQDVSIDSGDIAAVTLVIGSDHPISYVF
jgi:biotin carboxyl carrier protein